MNTDVAHNGRLRLARLTLAIAALALWFWTQSLIGRRAFPSDSIGDLAHLKTATLHQYLLDRPAIANGLLIVSSALTDALGIFILASAIFGPSVRPFLGLVLLMLMRQLAQVCCALPPPDGIIWHDPGFPSLLVTYGVANDLFFSGHTGIAVYGAIELSRLGRRWLMAGALVALFDIATVLVLRAHYTMDVIAGALAAFCAACLATRLAPACDRLITMMTGRKSER